MEKVSFDPPLTDVESGLEFIYVRANPDSFLLIALLDEEQVPYLSDAIKMPCLAASVIKIYSVREALQAVGSLLL